MKFDSTFISFESVGIKAKSSKVHWEKYHVNCDTRYVHGSLSLPHP